MRPLPPGPRANASPGRMRPPVQQQAPARKVFNCIVDDTALIAGVKKSTRDGIRKWVSQGAIRLCVPLHTLAQLDRLKKGNERINADAREAIKWLDDITSTPVAGVQLEGVDEAYTSWEEVEQYLVPETLLSLEESDSDEYSEDMDSSFAQLDLSDETSVSSSHSLDHPPKSPQSPMSAFSTASSKMEDGAVANTKALAPPINTVRNTAEVARSEHTTKGAVPVHLQPLFSHILWRIHKESNPEAALASSIMLTNDPQKQTIAQKFGIRAKRLEQLRDVVAREDREYKNHLTIHKLESGTTKPHAAIETPSKNVGSNSPRNSSANSVKSSDPTTAGSHLAVPAKSDTTKEEDSDDEDVVLFRAPRGPQAQNASPQRVIDPNDFGRAKHLPLRGARGGRGGFVPRGRGGPPRGRGGFGFVHAERSSVPTVPPFRPPPVTRYDPNQPIDPNSFARPTPRASPMRGNRRKLWEPN